MSQQQSPWLEGAYGWNFGEGGWNSGMDQNLLKFSFMFDRNVDSIVSSLPAAVSGQAHYLTTDNRLYFAVGSTYFSAPTPKWFEFKIRSTGATYQFNGTTAVQIESPTQIDTRLDAIELTMSSLGTAAFQDADAFATQVELDIAEAQAQSYTDLLRTDFENALDGIDTVLNYGAACDGVTDDTVAAATMLSAKGFVLFPRGTTSVIKNLQLNNNSKVYGLGTLKLPNLCSDFDRLIYATGKTGVEIYLESVDGNYAGQAGNIGTHLIYLTNCPDSKVSVSRAKDHFIASSATMPSIDGIRNASSGAIYLYRCHKASVNIGKLTGWGREGVYLEECNFSTVGLDHAQGVYTTEYSGLQVKGVGNTVTHASVDNAGASAVGFDTINGSISNIIATNTRENAGVNFGHTGFPATGSVASNIVVDGAYRAGISIGASSQDVVINGFSIRNCGEIGINVSDEVQRARVSNGSSEYNGAYNLYSSVAQVELRNTKYDAVDMWSFTLTAATGLFVDGETVTQGAATGVVRKALRNLDGSKQILLMQSLSDGWDAAAITGATSGATATILSGAEPITKREDGGGRFTEESFRFEGGSAGSAETLPSGTRIFTKTLTISANAGDIATVSENFPDFSSFVSAPQIQLTLIGGNNTDSFDISRLDGTATSSGFTVKLKASATQPYGVSIQAVGAWR